MSSHKCSAKKNLKYLLFFACFISFGIYTVNEWLPEGIGAGHLTYDNSSFDSIKGSFNGSISSSNSHLRKEPSQKNNFQRTQHPPSSIQTTVQPATETVSSTIDPFAGKVDYKRRFWIPWKEVSNCSHLRVQFLIPGSLPPCALASFPGSGSTWLRYLIETSTGFFTGSSYVDGIIYSKGFYGETEDWSAGTTVVQKTHQHELNTVLRFNRTSILLVRNPYKAILSFHNYQFASHTKYAPMENYRRRDWPSFVVEKIKKSWLKTIVTWVVNSDKLLVVHYEKLLHDPIKELEKINEFLSIPINAKRFECLKVESHLEGPFRRKSQYFSSNLELFNPTVRREVEDVIHHANTLLKLYKQPVLPTNLYEFYNGTKSTLSLVKCKASETDFECDERVDSLNNYGYHL